MNKYLLILMITTPVVMCGFSFGPKSGFISRKDPNPVTYKPDAKLYPVETLKNDLAEIKNILITNHPAPYQFTRKEAFEKLYAEQLNKINRPMNLGEYFLVAAPLVESIHCGHTWISMPDEFWDNDEALFFPTGFIFAGNKAYAEPAGNDNSIPRGSEIVSINKVPLSAIIESTKRLVNSDAFSKTGKLVTFGYTFPDLFALQYGNRDRYEVNFIPPGSSEIHVKVLKPVSRKTAWENATTTLAGSFAGVNNLHLAIEQSKNLAVLDIRSFSYYNNTEKFFSFIDSAFEQIRISGVQNLVLDLRNNSGGDPFCSAHLLSYLEIKPEPYFASAYEGYEKLAQPVPLAGRSAFAGNLLVLINGGCFSSTGHLCALLKYYHRGRFVGEETGGTYECNDSHVRMTTSATHMNMNVARMTYTAAVKGLSRETGIMPDDPVEPTIEDVLAGRDVVKEFAINLRDKGRGTSENNKE
jgi:hypothetical protein